MKAITVRQPWAWAIIHGGKDIENRTRNLAGSYRGPVAIHAGLTFDFAGLEDPAIQSILPTDTVGAIRAFDQRSIRGALIGAAELVDVHLETPTCCTSQWAQRVTRYDENPLHHLVLANPRPLTHPIPAKGRLGLWTLDVETQWKIGASFWADEIKARS